MGRPRERLSTLLEQSVLKTEELLKTAERKGSSREETLAALSLNRAETDAQAQGLLNADQFRRFQDVLKLAREGTDSLVERGVLSGRTATLLEDGTHFILPRN